MNTPIDYLSRYSFGHFCCRVKQGKCLYEFLQKYTDSVAETTHLAGYPLFFFLVVFASESGNVLTSIKISISRLFGATDGNFTEKYSVTPSS